ncbi:hypothetical protein EN813_010140 [Mesorhizobium sp. M00.F.Ca.ET.170.01.1.1]|nr:hypothetical protein EN813_010140 [Mesorhizobium sp. M00.F.Ca.ET.170.01.1.1]
MKPQQTDNETKLFNSVIADLRIAEEARDTEAQEDLHSELAAFAMSFENPTVRRAVAKVVNREMADMSTHKSFLREIAELKRSGRGRVTVTGEDVLEHTISAFFEFGRDPSTHPTVRALVSDAFAKPL